jgi:hypothetical protein
MRNRDKTKSKPDHGPSLREARVAVLVVVGLTVFAASVRALRRPSAVEPAATSAPESDPAPEAPVAFAAVATLPGARALDNAPVVPELALIDDMAKRTNVIDGPGLVGYWYAYSDGTGTTNPRVGGDAFPAILHDGKLAHEFSGNGQTEWGAGFGFDVTKSGAIRPRANAVTTPFDASAYSGIRFDATASGMQRMVEVAFSDADTNPRGGVCDPKATKNEPCNVDFAAKVAFPAGEWKTVTVPFSQLELPRWVLFPTAQQHGFQKDKLYSIHFQIHPAAPQRAIPDYDVFVANISFVR